MNIDPNDPPRLVDDVLLSWSAVDPAAWVVTLGFVSFQTPDVARLRHHHEKVLGFAVIDESPVQVYLTTVNDHHCVVHRPRPRWRRPHVCRVRDPRQAN